MPDMRANPVRQALAPHRDAASHRGGAERWITAPQGAAHGYAGAATDLAAVRPGAISTRPVNLTTIDTRRP